MNAPSHPSSPSYRRRTFIGSRSAIGGLVTVAVVVLAAWMLPASPPDVEAALEPIRRSLPFWTALPFAGMLLSIALFPLLAPSFWHHHFKKVAVAWAFAFAAPWLVEFGALGLFVILDVLLLDYVPFLILLWGLYTVSGGIMIRAKLVATPRVNVLLLAAGTVVASLMGTTGAAMLLVRPMLRANAWRHHKAHVFVFFIFLVANAGGLLTPLGDPPLFLGFLRGVPFFWTFRLLPIYLVTVGLLLAVFFAIDHRLMQRELHLRPTHEPPHRKTSFEIAGAHNFALLVGIMGAVLLSGMWQTPSFHWFGIQFAYRSLVRDLAILAIGLVSIVSTPAAVREENGFTWDAIKEVAYLFFGIFVTIIPALAILRAGTHGSLGPVIATINEPWEYFWMSGALSSFLDNAPTYLTFMTLALGQLGIDPSHVGTILTTGAAAPEATTFASFLKAVSAGSVLMGANTYIGNAPNFMVLSIAKEHGVKMPSFFGYTLWSLAILIPTFIVVTLLFF